MTQTIETVDLDTGVTMEVPVAERKVLKNDALDALEWYKSYFTQIYGGYIPDLPHHKTIITALQTQAELVEALRDASGTLNYIRTQAIANHSGFNTVAKMNADLAIEKIDKALARAEGRE